MPSESLPLEALQQIDRICDTFEAAWKAGLRPRIEEYLSATNLNHPTALLRELLAREVELRKRAGECLDAAEYQRRFAGYEELIHTVLNEPEPHEATAILDLPVTEPEPGAEVPEDMDYTAPATTATRVGFDVPDEPGGRTTVILPERIGRYRPIRLLGRGNFLVFLAVHEDDGREVAIKVTRPDNPSGRRKLMSLAEEAKRLAAVNHPGIVKVLEFVAPTASAEDSAPDGGFIVMEYVPGLTLEALLRKERLDPFRLARIMVALADALHHAHTAGLVHRDLKPSNILIDPLGCPKICDFGLAVDEEVQRLRRGEVAGTLHYMAPEQVRGETNRLDGRTDIWAVGVILYRGLTGRMPFRGNSISECFEEILRCEPRPPRQFGDAVPRELERICLRCLSRQMSDRYLTAADLGEDIKTWLANEGGEAAVEPAAPLALPKGFRGYDGEDASFFLSLLPGPRGGDGLPESVRFWKRRIEPSLGSPQPSVGLLYGLSGGGKSSFARAGLVPHLDPQQVRSIIVDAGPTGTEARLLAELRRAAPLLPGDCDLAEAVALLRDDPSVRPRQKVLLVLDQFEQWLQGNLIGPDALLVRALRQCDGVHVQFLLLVRDDFWTATTRLFRAIDVPLIDGTNAMAVELFDVRHARKVLENFGRALGQISGEEITPGGETDRFLTEAVSGLTGPDGRIVPVRLSLFVEVLRNRPWTIENLLSLGGMEGIGVKFLEEALDSPMAPPANRLHSKAAEAVLKLLLPPSGAGLRSAPRSGRELREGAGYNGRPRDFADLMTVLDHDLRLVTPVEGKSACDDPEGAGQQSGEPCYQLAHDYLIRPIRQWLEGHVRASREGRAQLRLEAISSAWVDHPGARRLPSLLEYLGILLYTRRSSWSPAARRVMRAASRHFLIRLCILACFVAAIAMNGRELSLRIERRDLLNRALTAKDSELLPLIARLEPIRNRVITELEGLERGASPDDNARKIAGILLFRFAPTPERGRYLHELLLGPTEPERVELVCECLAAHPELAMPDVLRGVLTNDAAAPGDRLRAACALAALQEDRLDELEGTIPAIASALLQEPIRKIPGWLRLLRPLQEKLVARLREMCANADVESVTRTTAAEALSQILTNPLDPARLAQAVVNSQADAARIFLRELASHRPATAAADYFNQVVNQYLSNKSSDERQVARSTLAAIGLEALGDANAVSRLLSQDQADPRVRALLIHRQADICPGRARLVDRLAEPDLSSVERYALLLACAETRPADFTPALRGRLLELAARLFRDDPDPGVHSAAEILLRRLKGERLLAAAEEELRRAPAEKSGNRWYLGPEGHTFAIIPDPVTFLMGEPAPKDAAQFNEKRHYRRIDRSFAIATKEVSIERYRRLHSSAAPDNHFKLDPQCPAGVKWYEAARYCNWLSERAGIPRDQWCYPEPVQPGMVLAEDAIDRTGYRLPTEAEWEYVCRAGASTSRFFGSSDDLFPRYGWTWLNSQDRAWPIGQLLPNSLGMFDILGNVWEWCHNGPQQGKDSLSYPSGTSIDHPALDQVEGGKIDESVYRVLRGGAFNYSPVQARAAFRFIWNSDYTEEAIGFRVARTLPPRAAE